ncbi:MAG: universal stress protein [Actinomycetota bacterium]|nr:universal stress protein [Actinomycetota bacterium]
MPERNAAAGVVVGTDGSDSSLLAVRWAAHEATYRRAGLTVAHVVADSAPGVNGPPDAGDIVTRAVEAADSGAHGIGEVRVAQPHGRPVAALAELSRTAELIVVGGHGRSGKHRRDLGPVAHGLVQHAHCPVGVVRDDPAPSWRAHRPVLVGIDGSRASKLAAAVAFEEACWRGVELLALHVCHDTEAPPATGRRDPGLIEAAEAILRRSLAELRERYPAVSVSHLIRFANPARQLLVQGERAQLVVVGSHGRGGFTGKLLGSVGTAVAQDARASVIVARRH